MIGYSVEPMDCTPAAEEVADVIHALISELLDRGYQMPDLIEGAEIQLAAMKLAAHGELH